MTVAGAEPERRVERGGKTQHESRVPEAHRADLARHATAQPEKVDGRSRAGQLSARNLQSDLSELESMSEEQAQRLLSELGGTNAKNEVQDE